MRTHEGRGKAGGQGQAWGMELEEEALAKTCKMYRHTYGMSRCLELPCCSIRRCYKGPKGCQDYNTCGRTSTMFFSHQGMHNMGIVSEKELERILIHT